MRKAKLAGLKNVERMDTSGELKIDLPEESVDVVLLFDILHSYYYPQIDERRGLLEEIYRILKPSGFISVWPKHMESEAQDEIESTDFYLESEYTGTLIHNDHDREKGKAFNFKKRRWSKKQVI